jgi:ankyrin repeat protein
MARARRVFLEIVKLLLESGAEVDAVTSDNETAMLLACSLGQLDVVKLFLSHGTAVNSAKNSSGMPPLHESCREGHLEIMKLLIEHGANINARALGTAGSGHKMDRRTPLMFAVERSYLEAVRVLLRSGARIHTSTKQGEYDTLFFAKRAVQHH